MEEVRTVWGGQEPAECASCGELITAGQPVISDEDGHHFCDPCDTIPTIGQMVSFRTRAEMADYIQNKHR